VSFYGAQGPVDIDARVAGTAAEWLTGFSGQARIGANEAIFFAFPYDTQTGFTMANTRFPLDMLFLDANARVVWMIENAAALGRKAYVSPRPFRYVIEAPAGWFRSHGIGYESGVAWPERSFANSA
jgi:uncharacterized membrane protein (UPF0127 family)